MSRRDKPISYKWRHFRLALSQFSPIHPGRPAVFVRMDVAQLSQSVDHRGDEMEAADLERSSNDGTDGDAGQQQLGRQEDVANDAYG